MSATPCTDHDAEAAYLTAVMMRPDVVLEHPIRPDDVSARAHVLAYEAMAAIVRRRVELTTQSLQSELERFGVAPTNALEIALNASTGAISLPAMTAKRLRELGEMRRRREQALRIAQACEAHALDDARGLCASLAQLDAHAEVAALSFGGIVENTLDAFVSMGSERDRSIALGTRTVDDLWRPYPGSLTVVGAATGTGKSTLLTSWCLSMAQRGIANGIVSAEDPVDDFGSKMLGELGQVDPARIWRGHASAIEMQRILAAAEDHARLPISFAHVISRRLDDVLGAMRIQARQHGARVIAVDYLQTIIARPGSGRDPRDKVDAVLGELIVEAGALGVALVLASQLRRADRDSAAEPTVNALKESGTIENRAQAIVLLWRDGDARDVVQGKLAKVKRVPGGRRFVLVRNGAGQLVEGQMNGGDEE